MVETTLTMSRATAITLILLAINELTISQFVASKVNQVLFEGEEMPESLSLDLVKLKQLELGQGMVNDFDQEHQDKFIKEHLHLINLDQLL